jgi:hypothetical protein
MLTLTVNGRAVEVASGKLTLPRVGVWHAERLVVDLDAVPSGAITATLSEVDMPAHIQRAELIRGMVQMRIVGGAGGLGLVARPKHYRNTTVGHVARDLLTDVRETLSTASPTETLNKPLSYWTSLRLPTGALMQALCDTVGASWRVWHNGTVWIGQETWPACPADVRVIEADASSAHQVVGTDSQGIWPGTTLAGRRVDLVVHEIDPEKPRSLVWFAEGHA